MVILLILSKLIDTKIMGFDFTNEESLLFIISAPSGVGKTTIRKILTSQIKDFRYSISYTTRLPRVDEVDGQDYYFISKEVFQEKIGKDFFLEWAKVHENFYGTSKDFIKAALEERENIFLDVDVQGACSFKKKLPGAVFIFLIPPSWEALEERLRNRKTDTVQEIKHRLITAKKEVHCCYEYDYLIVNNNLEETVAKFKAIILAEQCRPSKMKYSLQGIW